MPHGSCCGMDHAGQPRTGVAAGGRQWDRRGKKKRNRWLLPVPWKKADAEITFPWCSVCDTHHIPSGLHCHRLFHTIPWLLQGFGAPRALLRKGHPD